MLPRSRATNPHWDSVAHFCVAAVRADVARAGPSADGDMLVGFLCADNAEFAAMWRDTDVPSFGGGTRHLRHRVAGVIAMA